jgi:hypothetical protein
MRITDSKDESRWPPDQPPAVAAPTTNIPDGARITLIAHDQTYTLTYFERRIDPYGVVRVVTTPEGLEIWVGGEHRYTQPKPRPKP